MPSRSAAPPTSASMSQLGGDFGMPAAASSESGADEGGGANRAGCDRERRCRRDLTRAERVVFPEERVGRIRRCLGRGFRLHQRAELAFDLRRELALGHGRPLSVRALEAVRRADRVRERPDAGRAQGRHLLERLRHHRIERGRHGIALSASGFARRFRILREDLRAGCSGRCLPENGTCAVRHS